MNYSFERGVYNNLDFKQSGLAKITEDEIMKIHPVIVIDKGSARTRDLF
jgi:hypothetical protein